MNKHNLQRTPDDLPPHASFIEVPSFLRKRFPDASEEQLIEMTQNLADYVRAVMRIFDRLEREGKLPIETKKFDSSRG